MLPYLAYMHEGLHISLAAEKLFTVWGLPVTNTLLAAWLAVAVLLVVAFFAGRNVTLIPGRVQNFFELIFDFLIGYMENILGSRALALRFFPLIATLFLFIAVANMSEFMPFFGSIGIHHGDTLVPLFHAANADLNTTLALAIIAVFSIEIAGIMALGFWKYGSKFFNFSSPLLFAVGLIEFVSELSRFISFSFRLFGNVFAGGVLLAVVAYFMPYVLPVPLMAFELFVGIVQGAVFAMLTLFFIKLAITQPHGQHKETHPPAHT